MDWRGKQVLVTGAGGFIGSHLTERLAREGARVRALVRYNALGSRGWLEDADPSLLGAGTDAARPSAGGDDNQIEVFAGDVSDPARMREAMEGAEVVFHLAALITIPYSYHAPLSYVRTNVEGALNVLQAARDGGVERLVHTSTSEVYGTPVETPIRETHPLRAQSPYAASKIAADKLAEAFHLSFGLPVVTVRPFNTFGPRQSARSVIPAIIAQCLRGGPIRLGNLSPTRDMNYVANIVDGFLRAGAADGASVLGRTINLGSGRDVSVGDLARMIGQTVGGGGEAASIEVEEQRVRPAESEVERLVADNALARQLLGWTPAVSLEEGLERTIEWVRTHAGRYRPEEYAF